MGSHRKATKLRGAATVGHDMKEILHPRSRVPETVYNQRVQAPDFVGANSFCHGVPTGCSPSQARRLTVG